MSFKLKGFDIFFILNKENAGHHCDIHEKTLHNYFIPCLLHKHTGIIDLRYLHWQIFIFWGEQDMKKYLIIVYDNNTIW